MIRCEHRKDPAGKTEDAPEEAASGSRDKKPVMKRPAAKMSLPKKAAKARLEEPMEDSPIPSPAEEETGRCTFAKRPRPKLANFTLRKWTVFRDIFEEVVKPAIAHAPSKHEDSLALSCELGFDPVRESY